MAASKSKNNVAKPMSEAEVGAAMKQGSRKSKSKLPSWYWKIGVGIVVMIALIVASWLQEDAEDHSNIKFDYPDHADVRPKTCPRLVTSSGPRNSVSIIIPYLNEEWFRMKATMQSMLRHTDMGLIREIIWISDGCAPDKIFAQELKDMHRKVQVHVNVKNLGIILTKANAAAKATGSILMFLEPHILLTPGWLPPMLNAIVENPKLLVMPILDVLDEKMLYHKGSHGHWRLEWNLQIMYSNPLAVPDYETSNKAYHSPATSGGIYAIRKDFWDQLDFFDEDLLEWGGDHIEASHKVWRCGGRIEIHPCSRIAHWFRNSIQQPYDVKVQQVMTNYKRLAHTWFDGFLDVFTAVRPEVKDYSIGDMTSIKQRRKKLMGGTCKSMEWYVKNVDMELRHEVEQIRTQLPAPGKFRSSDDAKVSCGGHMAPDCSSCSEGMGELWCNGDCEWRNDECIFQESLRRAEAARIAAVTQAQVHIPQYSKVTPKDYKELMASAEAFENKKNSYG